MQSIEPRPAPEPKSSRFLRSVSAVFVLAVGLIVGGLSSLLIGSYGATLDTVPALRVGYNLWIGYQPLPIARDAGKMSNHIVLLEARSTSAILEALKFGTIDAAAVTLDEALRIANEGVPISVVLALDVSNGADVILARSPSVAQGRTAGRRIGVETDAVGAFVLHRWLALQNLQISDVTVVDIPPPNHPRAFSDFDVDFLVTYEPIASGNFAAGAVRVFDSSKIAGEIVDVFVVRRDRMNAQERNLRALGNAWFAGTRILLERTGDAIERLSRHQQLGSDDVALVLGKIHFPDPKENAEIFRQGRLRAAADWISRWLESEGSVVLWRSNLEFSDILAKVR